jgi:hypothetical protein
MAARRRRADEWFPVKKKLLRPCIALTQAVQHKGDAAAELRVAVDCPTFDRLLLFLEAEALGRAGGCATAMKKLRIVILGFGTS